MFYHCEFMVSFFCVLEAVVSVLWTYLSS